MDELATNPVEFGDLPLELVAKIAKDGGLPVRLTLRKVSKQLRSIIDKLEANYNHLGIQVNENCIRLKLDGFQVFYRRTKKMETVVGTALKTKKLQKSVMNAVFDDLRTFMHREKINFKKFEISFTDAATKEEFYENYQSSEIPEISSKYILIQGQSMSTFDVIPCWFNPKKAEHVEFVAFFDADESQMLRYHAEIFQLKPATFTTFYWGEYYSKETGECVHEAAEKCVTLGAYLFEKPSPTPQEEPRKQTTNRKKQQPQPKRSQPKWNAFFSKHNSLK